MKVGPPTKEEMAQVDALCVLLKGKRIDEGLAILPHAITEADSGNADAP